MLARYPRDPERPEDRRAASRSDGTRAAGWVKAKELYCLHGHHINDPKLGINERVWRCKWRATKDARECGALIWTIPSPRLGIIYAVELRSQAELDAISEHPEILDTLVYVGEPRWPGRRRQDAA